jgi:hypothetical protein
MTAVRRSIGKARREGEFAARVTGRSLKTLRNPPLLNARVRGSELTRGVEAVFDALSTIRDKGASLKLPPLQFGRRQQRVLDAAET